MGKKCLTLLYGAERGSLFSARLVRSEPGQDLSDLSQLKPCSEWADMLAWYGSAFGGLCPVRWPSCSEQEKYDLGRLHLIQILPVGGPERRPSWLKIYPRAQEKCLSLCCLVLTCNNRKFRFGIQFREDGNHGQGEPAGQGLWGGILGRWEEEGTPKLLLM